MTKQHEGRFTRTTCLIEARHIREILKILYKVVYHSAYKSSKRINSNKRKNRGGILGQLEV